MQISTQTDFDFAEAIRQYRKTKNPDIFQRIYEASYDPVRRYLLSLGHNEQLTEEAMQSGYIVCFEKMDQLDDGAKFVPWLKTICYREYLALVKQQGKSFSLDAPNPEGEEKENTEPADTEVLRMPEEVAAQKELQKLLSETIYALPEGQRITMLRFYYDEASIRTIAEELGVPENTVKSYLSRGRRTLNRRICNYANAYGLKLVPVAMVPFIASLFKTEVEASGLTATGEMVRASYAAFASAEAGRHAASAAASNAASSAAAKTAESAVKTAAGSAAKSAAGAGAKSVTIKVAAGVTAAAVAGGGAAAVIKHQKTPEPIQEEAVETDPYQPYKDLMAEIPEGTEGDGKRIFYRLYDLDKNGTLELFVTNEEDVRPYENSSGAEVWRSTAWDAYTIQDGELKKLGTFGGLRAKNDLITANSNILADFEEYAKVPVLVEDHDGGYTEYLYDDGTLTETYEMVYPSQEGASNGQVLDASGNLVLALDTEYLRSNGYASFSAIDKGDYWDLNNIFEYHNQEFLDYFGWKTGKSTSSKQE